MDRDDLTQEIEIRVSASAGPITARVSLESSDDPPGPSFRARLRDEFVKQILAEAAGRFAEWVMDLLSRAQWRTNAARGQATD